MIPLVFILFLFPQGLPLFEAFERGVLFTAPFGVFAIASLVCTSLNGFLLFVFRNPTLVIGNEILLLAFEFLKGGTIRSFGEFYNSCWIICMVFYAYFVVNTTWLAILNPGHDYYPELKKKKVHSS